MESVWIHGLGGIIIKWFNKLKFRNFMINIKKIITMYIEIEISLLTKSGPHYSSPNRRDFQICKSPGDKALTRETPAKRGRVNRYDIRPWF
jgi:hypothetical protein